MEAFNEGLHIPIFNTQNLGATCRINAILQCLTSCTGFISALRKARTPTNPQWDAVVAVFDQFCCKSDEPAGTTFITKNVDIRKLVTTAVPVEKGFEFDPSEYFKSLYAAFPEDVKQIFFNIENGLCEISAEDMHKYIAATSESIIVCKRADIVLFPYKFKNYKLVAICTGNSAPEDIPKLDKNGKPILDTEGNPVMQIVMYQNIGHYYATALRNHKWYEIDDANYRSNMVRNLKSWDEKLSINDKDAYGILYFYHRFKE